MRLPVDKPVEEQIYTLYHMIVSLTDKVEMLKNELYQHKRDHDEWKRMKENVS